MIITFQNYDASHVSATCVPTHKSVDSCKRYETLCSETADFTNYSHQGNLTEGEG